MPLIGAPEAWKAGFDGSGTTVAVLDTGVDATHPDLAGRIADSRSFVDGQEVTDGHGHGTHVAATVAGSGAASGGSRKGVAPGARLVIGKVLGDSGSGNFSGIIAGMEWAATEAKAKIISMSLGGTPTAGTDPMSQAVEDLSASTGTLFVIAAGNTGPGRETIGTPGAAASALTVAATDKSDKLAGFSSRGPRAGDGALKPDIAAPGVGIVAARAAGTALGSPVDDRHTSLNGTSMATPHVAGAAALLAQKHPGWNGQRLKAALMSTVKDAGYTAYEQGADRVDVARATSQEVVSTTPNLDYGAIPVGTDGAVERTVTYANDGAAEVTLPLGATLGEAKDALTPSAPSVTVPAGGTASVTVTLHPDGLAKGDHTGAVVATGPSGAHITTPVGLRRGPKKVPLTVHVVNRHGDLPLVQEFWVAAGAVDVPDTYGAGKREFVGDGTYCYTNGRLAAVDTAYQAPKDLDHQFEAWHSFKPLERISFSMAFGFATPARRTEYFSGFATDTLRKGTVSATDRGSWELETTIEKPGRDTRRWGAVPATPGSLVLPEVPGVQYEVMCSMCRIGDTFLPAYTFVTGSGRQAAEGGSVNTNAKLFRDGKEIPRAGGSAIPAFTLPNEEGVYRLEQSGPGTVNAWTFHSRGRDKDTDPPTHACYPLAGSSGPCNPQPLVFVGYDLRDTQALDNTVPAGGRHTFEIDVTHSASTERMPAIAGLKLAYSTDDGRTWQDARVHKIRDGVYTTTLTYPALANTKGAVSLKAEAWDAEGNKAEQTTTRAFPLR
ncbi:S8 family serine peptidase [Streptosporangium sp. CA-115845]|uniref:S8 family peptidase n=1 Tax=Streptosporangium sp. CA-115845 TaxID=3240071 RepID=UPI003D8A9DA3